MRNEILNGDFSDSFNNWLNGVAGGYPFVLDAEKAKAASFSDSEELKTFKLRQAFNLNNELTVGALSVSAVWQLGASLDRDDFDDAVIGDDWTTFATGANRTIIEAGGALTFVVNDGTDARWFGYGGDQKNLAPRAYKTLSPILPCEIITKLNTHIFNEGAYSGIFIATTPEGKAEGNAYLFGYFRSDHAEAMGLRVDNLGASPLAWKWADYSHVPEWLKIAIDADGVITFWWSEDGISYTQMTDDGGAYSLEGYYAEGITVGLFGSNGRDYFSTNEAVATVFEFFEVDYDLSVVFTVNLIKPSNTVVELGSWTKTTDGSGALFTDEDIIASLDEAGNYYLELVCEFRSIQIGSEYNQCFGWYDDIALDSAKKFKRAIFEKLIMGESIYYGGKLTLDLEKMVFGETVTPLKIDNQDPNWDESEGVSTQWVKDKKILDT